MCGDINLKSFSQSTVVKSQLKSISCKYEIIKTVVSWYNSVEKVEKVPDQIFKIVMNSDFRFDIIVVHMFQKRVFKNYVNKYDMAFVFDPNTSFTK